MLYPLLMKRKLIHIALILFLGVSLKAQLNLVPNPSFEEKEYCPNFSTQIDPVCKEWFTPIAAMPIIAPKFATSGWGSSDYYHRCATIPELQIPSQNGFGYQETVTGDAYAGFALSADIYQNGAIATFKEYIEVELIQYLTPNYLYRLEFHYSITNDEYYFNNPNEYYAYDVQALLTDTLLYRIYDSLSPNWVENINAFTPFNHTFPQTVDTTSWFKASFDFVAKGGEKFLTIGSFKDYPFANGRGAYIYIDDVSLTYIGPDTSVAIPEIRVYPNPAKDKIYIKQEEGSLQGTRFELYDLNGRLMIHYTITEDSKEITLPVWHLSSSVYIYAIRKDGELLKMDKLVVLR